MSPTRLNTVILFSILLLLSIANQSIAQIVNIEKARKVTDTTGVSGGMELRGSYLENETSILDLSIIPDIQYKTKKDLWLLIGSYNLTQSEDVDFQNSGLIHLRYNHKVNSLLRLEAFNQIQKDKVNKIDYRYLAGAGPRFKFIDIDSFKLYVGLTPMLELERTEAPESMFRRQARLSNYVSFTYDFNEQSSFYSTSYYQPNFASFSDFRFYTENKFTFTLLKHVDFDFTTTYSWDSEPPLNATGRFVKIAGGFSFSSR